MPTVKPPDEDDIGTTAVTVPFHNTTHLSNGSPVRFVVQSSLIEANVATELNRQTFFMLRISSIGWNCELLLTVFIV